MNIVDFEIYLKRRQEGTTVNARIIAGNDNHSVNDKPIRTSFIYTEDGWYGYFQFVNGTQEFVPIWRQAKFF